MKVELSPGEAVIVTFEGTDGEITVEFNEDNLTVRSDLADTSGREGVIYQELFGDDGEGVKEIET